VVALAVVPEPLVNLRRLQTRHVLNPLTAALLEHWVLLPLGQKQENLLWRLADVLPLSFLEHLRRDHFRILLRHQGSLGWFAHVAERGPNLQRRIRHDLLRSVTHLVIRRRLRLSFRAGFLERFSFFELLRLALEVSSALQEKRSILCSHGTEQLALLNLVIFQRLLVKLNRFNTRAIFDRVRLLKRFDLAKRVSPSLLSGDVV
jgi:hypothetical protein